MVPNVATVDVVCLGVLILDVHAFPVTEIPEGQGGQRIEQIRLSAAGAAAGTAVDLSILGCSVATLGAIGTDEIGDFLLSLLAKRGIDTSGVRRTSDAQTSATVLPIRPNGDRPTFHVVGANARYRLDDTALALIGAARHLHLGGPDSMGLFIGDGARQALECAAEAGVKTSLDILGGTPSRVAGELRALFPFLDWLTPNEEQLCDLYALDDPLVAAYRAIDDGVGGVVVSLGADGCLVVDGAGVTHVPGRRIEVIDTTGCGDALSAGFIAGLLDGEPPSAAAELGVATASIVTGVLSSDPGVADRVTIDNARWTLAPATPTRRY